VLTSYACVQALQQKAEPADRWARSAGVAIDDRVLLEILPVP
jgi:hypothetical protein